MTTNGKLVGMRFELGLGDTGYPPILKDIPNPPKRLYGIGDPESLAPGIAIIGARRASPYGLSVAERFAGHAARRGLTIIAGGARGCDLAAHRTAVDMEATTVVVFGSGADVVYPKSGHDVFQRAIDQGGAVISENPWGTPPRPPYFPQRNRIIAGLSILLLIAEAGLPSGTFSTADAALAQGKDVAVVPGNITSPNARGSNRLLCQGAIPVVDFETFDDALAQAFLKYPVAMAQDPVVEDAAADDAFVMRDPVMQALSAEAYSPEELAAYFGFSCSELARRLSCLEIEGVVERGRDGRYQLSAHVRQ